MNGVLFNSTGYLSFVDREVRLCYKIKRDYHNVLFMHTRKCDIIQVLTTGRISAIRLINCCSELYTGIISNWGGSGTKGDYNY